ncbi:MAG: hypothetical protein NT144_13775 [Bacteroidia bacterium]|nr:hypothetical protein [Bacteroidia bacterium]
MAEETWRYIDKTTDAKPEANRTGDYDLGLAREIYAKAQAKGVDPKIAVSIAMVESNLGKKWPSNPMQLRERTQQTIAAGMDPVEKNYQAAMVKAVGPDGKIAPEVHAKLKEDYEKNLTKVHRSANIDAALDHFKQVQGYAKAAGFTDPVKLTQAYNGLGTINASPEKPYYGRTAPINMAKDPVYGRLVHETIQGLPPDEVLSPETVKPMGTKVKEAGEFLKGLMVSSKPKDMNIIGKVGYY